MTDLGFPRRVAPTSELEQKPIIWQDFCHKPRENERNRRGCTSLATPLDPPMKIIYYIEITKITVSVKAKYNDYYNLHDLFKNNLSKKQSVLQNAIEFV